MTPAWLSAAMKTKDGTFHLFAAMGEIKIALDSVRIHPPIYSMEQKKKNV
jgi:hypothetical protein